MAGAATLRFSLEFACGDGPITGRLADGSGAHWEFVGWMQLALVLEEALNAQRPAGGGSADHHVSER